MTLAFPDLMAHEISSLDERLRAVEMRDRAVQAHEDLRALTLAVERVALALEGAASGEQPVHVKQAGKWSQTSYNVTP